MKFSEVLEALKNGERLTNASLSNTNGFIVCQVPQVVDKEIIPRMTSLPDSAKEHLKGSDLKFHDQVLLVQWCPMQDRYVATSYVPNWYDIFREDWTIC